MIETAPADLASAAALRAALGTRSLLGFSRQAWTEGTPTAKPAFVGELIPAPNPTPTGPPPANDEIQNAIRIGTGTAAGPNTSGTNTDATLAQGEPTAGSNSTQATVWYVYTPTADAESVTIDTRGMTRATGGNQDTTLGVYTLTDPALGPAYNNLTTVAGDDDNGSKNASLVTIPVTAGRSYYIQVGGYAGNRGTFELNENGPASIASAPGQDAPCYVTGTRIRVWRNGTAEDVAVEQLALGDLAITSSGAHCPIRWIANRTVSCRNHREPHHVHPVQIRAHAFGENKPARDLRVSPGHAIAIDILGEVLIPAIALINGSTITQETVETVTYWHVELDSHDILIAEGQPAESYLDMGNRGFFADGGVVTLDATPDADAAARTHADFCRPFHAEGALVDIVRGQLRRRAETLGWRIVQGEPWAGVHLEVDGRIVQPKTRGLTACFELPSGVTDVVLVSPTSVPMHVWDLRDRRALGLPLKSLHLDDGLGEARAVALDDPLLDEGFHGMAHDHRWTAGRARLPAALLEGLEGTAFLRVELSMAPVPQLIAPQAADAMSGDTVVSFAA